MNKSANNTATSGQKQKKSMNVFNGKKFHKLSKDQTKTIVSFQR